MYDESYAQLVYITVGSSLIVVGICSTKVVFAYVTVNHTIPRNKYLFQSGRLLLTYIVLLSPTIGNPDDFDITRSPAYYQFITSVSCPVRTNISRRFFLRFRTPVSLWKRSSSHSVAVILLIFVIASENSTELTSFSFRGSLRCCCCSTASSPHSAFVFVISENS